MASFEGWKEWFYMRRGFCIYLSNPQMAERLLCRILSNHLNEVGDSLGLYLHILSRLTVGELSCE
jgi:hypothetical protein